MRREVKNLQPFLAPGEIAEAATAGTVVNSMWLVLPVIFLWRYIGIFSLLIVLPVIYLIGLQRLLVRTNQRYLFLKAHPFSSWKATALLGEAPLKTKAMLASSLFMQRCKIGDNAIVSTRVGLQEVLQEAQ